MVGYLSFQDFTEGFFLVKWQSEHIEISGDVLGEQVALLYEILLYLRSLKVRVKVSVYETIVWAHLGTRSIILHF